MTDTPGASPAETSAASEKPDAQTANLPVPVRAESPVKPVTDFVRDHPVLVLAGGLAAVDA